jgi:phosphate transport system permease protein
MTATPAGVRQPAPSATFAPAVEGETLGPLSIDTPRRVGAKTADDRFAVLGCLIAALGLSWLVYDRVLGFSGRFGFLVFAYAVFLGLYWAVSAMAHPRPQVVDRLVSAAIHGAAGLVVIAVGSTIIYTFWEGRHALAHAGNFLTRDSTGVVASDPLSHGGIEHAIVGTLIQLSIATAVSLPLGVGTAIFISEVGGGFARIVRTVVEAMTALPDILAGLFIYTTLIVHLGFQFSGFCAATALSVMMLPIIARSTEVVLRVVPGGLREASLALGATKWRTVLRVVLPTARSGIATSLILGIARAVGETAPVLLTSGAATYFNADPLHNPMNSLPLYIFTTFLLGHAQIYQDRMFGAASVLLGLVLVLFVTARVLARSRTGRP